MANIIQETLQRIDSLLSSQPTAALGTFRRLEQKRAKAYLNHIIQKNPGPFDDATAASIEQKLIRFFMIRESCLRSNGIRSDNIYLRLIAEGLLLYTMPKSDEKAMGEWACKFINDYPNSRRNAYELSQTQAAQGALMWAVTRRKQEDILRILKEPDIHLFERTSNHKNILHIAAESNWVEIVEVLMSLPGAERLTTEIDKEGSTPLHYAAIYGHDKIAEILLKHKSTNVNAQNFSKNTPLSLAAPRQFHSVVEVLLENNANVDIKTQYDKTALEWAVTKQAAKTVLLFSLHQERTQMTQPINAMKHKT